ncbi:choice-of-anchor G family protein [Curtobacterium sp. RHCJP20]|uniref:Choice-of-anchor G family protein n=1 Tax=Curtobacterium subtropicum TaxID=3055138 RepID=A0ABT7TD72_9MICO|nr:choice-of-anchor G family protein [Curtobacterium subtropicum]
MLRELRRGPGAVLVAILAVVGATAAVAVPGPTSSTAAWQDAEWVHGDGAIGTSSFSCGEDVGYTANSSSRFLAGNVAGQDLGAVADLRGLDVTKTGTQGVAVSPATAPEITRTETTAAYGNPLDVGVLGSVAGLDLTGLGTGLPGGSAGAVNQVATSVATGRSVAASGLVSDSGGVLVTDTTPTEALPEPATLDLGQALAGVADLQSISDVGLEVGAVGSSAQLDGCDLLEDEVWGAARTATVTRDYGIASLDLRIDSPLVRSLTSSVDATVRTLDAAIAEQSRDLAGLLTDEVEAWAKVELDGILRIGLVEGTASITAPDLSTVLAPVLRETLTDGVVTVDLASGQVRVDLAHLAGSPGAGLNGLPPNTELVLDDRVVADLSARVGALLDGWTTRVTERVTALLASARVQVQLDVGSVKVLGIQALKLELRLDASLGAVLSGTAQLTVTPRLIGISLLPGVLDALTAQLRDIVNSTVGTLVAVAAPLRAALTSTAASLVAAVSPVLRALPALLSVQVNVQRDTPGARDGRYARTGSYSVTAIRIGVLRAGGGTPLARVDLASSTVGPNLVDLGAPRS